MRVALLYPPPWKIPAPGQPLDASGDGPPREYRPGDLDADFYQTPYGLFALGAGAIRAGHQVKIYNLSAMPWGTVDDALLALEADVYGMSCWTANRRGVVLAAKALRAYHPRAHIVVGGPHATPLAKELLEHCSAIDTVCLGESDATFLELLDRLSAGAPTPSLAGTAFRRPDGKVEIGASRKNVEHLDSLASPHDYFDTHIVMTSRGCAWACTFCGAEATWGRGFRGNSVGYTVDALEKLTRRLPVKMVQVKDDTFTTNKTRVMQLCKTIRERNLKFLWSCDTRVDLLTEPLLREMRLAGCQRLSLGVESGSQRILDAIDKKITVDEIIASTELAKKVGLRVRYFMMLGNRGETAETFRETLAFLERARPHEFIFSCLSVYPGTRDFDDAEAAGWLSKKAYFEGDFQELKMPYDASEEDTALMNAWFRDHSGLRVMYEPNAEECRAVLETMPDHAPAHMDLAGACFRERDFERAERHVRLAMERGYPLPGIAYNYLACIAKERGDLDAMMELFSRAAQEDPQHYVLIQNVQAARAWFKQGGPAKGVPLQLRAHHDFQLLERTVQPTLPGPLPEDFAVWSEAPTKPLASPTFVRTPDVEGSGRGMDDRRRLRVI